MDYDLDDGVEYDDFVEPHPGYARAKRLEAARSKHSAREAAELRSLEARHGEAATAGMKVEPELVYLIARRPSAKVQDVNLLQAFTHVLSQSKVLFLEKIVRLVNALDPSCAQVAYYDTDGALVLMRHPSIAANLVPGRREAFLRDDAPSIFVDEASPVPQAALLKAEGLYKAALVKAVKAYRCIGFDPELDREELEDIARIPDAIKPSVGPASSRLKGCARYLVASLDDSVFAPEVSGRDIKYVTSTGLRPTTGLEMSIMRASRRLPLALNNKRYTPKVSGGYVEDRKKRKSSLIFLSVMLSGWDRVISLALRKWRATPEFERRREEEETCYGRKNKLCFILASLGLPLSVQSVLV
jgi:hypothetical protein